MPEGIFTQFTAHFCLLGKYISDGLTHVCVASHKMDIGKQCRPISDAASDQGLHCLH